MKLTRSQVREFSALKAELNTAGVPDLITRAEAARLCDKYALDAPMYQRGNQSTPFRRIDVIVYMVRRGVCPSRTRRFSMSLGGFVS